MKIAAVLLKVRRLFLDSSPVIHHTEGVAAYQPLMDHVFKLGNSGQLEFVTSTITLSECLVLPLRAKSKSLQRRFRRLITRGRNTVYVGVDKQAEAAAELRARYQELSLPDAFQIAAAVAAHCDALLTNDRGLIVAKEIPILILDDLEL